MEIKRFETNERMSKVVLHNNTLYLCGQTHDEGDKNHILSATIYLKDIAKDFKDMNSVWDAWVEKGFAPARACVEANMARECLLVEISIIAAAK